MCRHLQEAGYRITIHTRTRSKASQLLDSGAIWASSPKAVAQQTDVIVTMVGFPSDVRDVYFGADGLLSQVRPGMVLVDMTSTEPSLAQELSRMAQTRAAHALDAPVSGGDVGARNATLSIMVGGAEVALQAIRPLLDCLGQGLRRGIGQPISCTSFTHGEGDDVDPLMWERSSSANIRAWVPARPWPSACTRS